MQYQVSTRWAFGPTAGRNDLNSTRRACSLDGIKHVAAIALAVLCPVAMAAAGAPVAQSAPTTTTATLNTVFFDFGNNLVGYSLTQTAVMITNTGNAPLSLSPAVTGDASFSIVASKSCGAELAAGKSCDEVVRYNPQTPSYPKSQNAVLHLHFGNAVAGTPESVALTGISAVLKAGIVSRTRNPQVALYTMTLPFPGRMKVQFGPTQNYGKSTWYQSTDLNNSQVSILVAGMKAKTTYHMIASIILGDRIHTSDPAGDQTFKTGAIPFAPVNYAYHVTATTTPGMKPQPGIEITNPLNGLAAFDLQGNQIWTYYAPSPFSDVLAGFKMLPNGNFLVLIGAAPGGNIGPIEEIREIDLAGNTVREISAADLNAALPDAPSSCTECASIGHVLALHHDVTPLPNGHLLILINMVKKLPPSQTGEKGTTSVLGDAVVDLDQNWNPVWVWNEFNHLDTKRHPMGWPDWTHSNAVLYSIDDGNFIVSIRHQNWIVKVNYRNGSGDGSIVWKLGAEGSFKLIGGSDPVDWQYAQHDPGYFGKSTAGVFSLGVMDNGDDRLDPARPKCTPQSDLPASCLYSTIPVFKVNEKAMTATLTFHQKLPHSPPNQAGKPFTDLYSFFGGNTDELANGDVEYDLCGLQIAPAVAGGPEGEASLVREVTQDANDPKTVWSLTLQSETFYRALRFPSLYPGVQW